METRRYVYFLRPLEDEKTSKQEIPEKKNADAFFSFFKQSDANLELTQKLRFTNAMWDENARINTVSPAGQMEAAEDDVLPAVPELNMPPRKIKK